MQGSHTFRQVKNSVGNFAHVSLLCHPGKEYAVHWSADENESKVIHSLALLQGIEDSYRKHLAEGGAPSAFTIEEVQELPVDTTADAMRCAAAMATWRALGHGEHSAKIIHDAEWRVAYS
jgi:hypothetical protein